MTSGIRLEVERREVDASKCGTRRARGGRGSSARALLIGRPREVLARLAGHDPLGVRELVATRLCERYLLMDAERVHTASLARIAGAASQYLGSPPLDEWLAREVDAAIDELREAEARAAEGAGSAVSEDPPRDAWSELARPLGLEPAAMRCACARFNLMPRAERQAFVHLVLERRSPDALARESGESLTELARRARRGIDVLLDAHGPGQDVPSATRAIGGAR